MFYFMKNDRKREAGEPLIGNHDETDPPPSPGALLMICSAHFGPSLPVTA